MASLPVFSSPLQRCAELAVQLHPAPTIDARLQELHFGDWERQTWDAIGPSALDDWAADIAGFRPPRGETGYELQQRVLAWLHDIAIDGAEMIVVTHAGVMRALQAYHLQLHGHQWLSLRYDYGQVLCLDFSAEQIRATSVQ
jgi:alpha-ribazole phosphatase